MKLQTKYDVLNKLEVFGDRISKEIKVINGFECIHHYVKLEKGWYPCLSEADDYELFYLVRRYGTSKDRKIWNKYAPNKLATSSKGISKESKERKINNKRAKRVALEKYGRKYFEKEIANFKDSGVPTSRRTNKDKYKGLYYFIVKDKNSEVFKHVSGKSKSTLCVLNLWNERGYPFISADNEIDSFEDLINYINERNISQKITIEDLKSGRFKIYSL